MVLLMLGLFGFLYLGSKAAENFISQNLTIQVFLDPNLSDSTIANYESKLKAEAYVASLTYISKERAAIEFSNELGQDFTSFLGFNPLMGSFQIKLNSAFNQPEQMKEIELSLKKMQGVTDVNYPKAAYGNAQANINRVGLLFVGLAAIFGIIAVVLIHNTVRLNLYARRFTIKSMQLVGATPGFILRPFLVRGLLNGFWGWLLASVLLGLIQNSLHNWIPEWESVFNQLLQPSLFAALLVVGLLISFLSSYFSTRKFLNTRLDDLY
jgi:cell division transport system permease protein